MSDVTLHPMPRWRDVVLEQVRIVGLSLRREALVVAAVLAAGTFTILYEHVRGGPGFDSSDSFPTALFAFFYPFAVWRREKRFGPDFLWTLPVDRRRLALAKVFAGWVWLTAAMAVFATWVLAMALLINASPALLMERVPFTATMTAYLFGSAVVLGLRHPLRWLLGTTGVLFLMGLISDVLHQPDDGEWRNVPFAQDYFSAVSRAAELFRTLPDPAQWAITTSLWFGAGAAVLWAAASRHRERRRQ